MENMNYELLKVNQDVINQVLQLSKEMIEDVKHDFVKEGEPYCVIVGHEWMRETFTLLLKQANLVEGCLLLLEYNMEEEAFILARSQFNNMLWISYLCNGNGDERVKEYYYESRITEHNTLGYLSKYVKNIQSLQPELEKGITKKAINHARNSIREILIAEEILKESDGDLSNKSIKSLAENDDFLILFYDTFYATGSRYEHANYTTIQHFRQPVCEEDSSEQFFVFDSTKSDVLLWKNVFSHTIQMIFLSICKMVLKLEKDEKLQEELKQSYIKNGTEIANGIMGIIKIANEIAE